MPPGYAASIGPASIVLAYDLDGPIDDGIGRRIVNEHDVSRGVDERGPADEGPVGIPNRVDVGAAHEVVPLRNGAQEVAHLGAHRMLTNDLGVDDEHDEDDVGLDRAGGPDDALRIARSLGRAAVAEPRRGIPTP